MNKPVDLPLSSFDDEDSNTSANPTFDAVLNARLSRRHILRGSLGTALTTAFGGLALAGCGGGDDDDAPSETLLGFSAVAKTLADTSTVPSGYTANTVFATGDPLFAGMAAHRNDGTDTGEAEAHVVFGVRLNGHAAPQARSAARSFCGSSTGRLVAGDTQT